MSNEYKPLLICTGKDRLICGECGYVFASYEAESLLDDAKIYLNNKRQAEVHSKPLRCIRCECLYKAMYFDGADGVSDIVMHNRFKDRYKTKNGKLILPEMFKTPLFIPSWDFDKARQMTYADSVAYMLHSKGYKAVDMTLVVSKDDLEMCLRNERILPDLYEDISNISVLPLRRHINEFHDIWTSMRDMEDDCFFRVGNDDE